MPALLLLYPDESPQIITSISLAVVFFNALSGSWAYGRMKRIDYKSGLLLSSAIIPGAILGALTTNFIPRRIFDLVFGLLMIGAALVLLLRRPGEKTSTQEKRPLCLVRCQVEKNGTVHVFSYDLKLGLGLSFFVGYISSLLGIGGGVVHVPALVQLLNFPVHIATATSHFMLAIMALTGTIVHISTGAFSHGLRRTICLAIGVMIGAQVGAPLSSRLKGIWIMRILALALAFIGIRILLLAFL